MNENVNVCITPKGEKPVLHFSQYDNERVFTVTVLADDGESAAVLTGLDIEFRIRKTDSHVVTIAPESVADNVITFKTTEQMCACCGQNIASVVLMKDDMIVSTLDILVDIQRDILSGGLTSESDIRNLTTQIEQIVPEVIGDDYYNKQEVDDLLAEHTFDPSNYYNKSDVDDLLEDKADADDVYTKAETDNLLADKADKSAIASLIVQKDVAKAPIASFNTDLAEALTKIIVDINPVQDLHGYSKPWSGGSGKNKLKITATTQTINGITFAIDNEGVITTSGTFSENTNLAVTTNFLLKAGTYILNGCPSGGSYSRYVVRIENGSAQRLALDVGNGDQFTLAEDTYVWCRIYIYSQDGIGKTFKPMVRLATETDANFEPYSNICPISGFSALNVTLADGDMQTVDTATVNFGQTVYGGVADVTNGKVTITQIARVFDGSENLLALASGRVFAYDFGVNVANSFDNNKSLCSHFHKGETSWDLLAVGEYLIAGGLYGGVNPDMTLADYRTYLQTQYNNGTPVTLVATLATPIEITTTPENLTAIVGQNNVYSDTNGDTEVRFTETIGNELGV